MKLTFIFSLLILATAGKAQDSIRSPAIIDSSKKMQGEEYDKTFIKVEIEAEYPGGKNAWMKFLIKNLRYPDDAVSNEIQGIVFVQFIVDREGNVSDVTPVSGTTKGGLREESVRLIKLSGKWLPAVQNGRQVKSYKKVPFTFKLTKG